MAEAVGIGFAVVGLLAAFKGALDSYFLIESIFEKDNGLRDLVLGYNIEREKLKSWGDRFGVNAGTEKDCLLDREPEQIKRLMAEIFGRIKYYHGEAENYLTKHEASDHPVDYHMMNNVDRDFKKHLRLDSVQVDAMSKAQMSKPQKKRVKWAIKNKEKFGDVVKILRKYNEDLLGLLTESSVHAYTRALPAYVLTIPHNAFDLQQAQGLTGPANVLIRQAAHLKLLQSTAANTRDAVSIDSRLLEETTAVQSSRSICIYNIVNTSLISDDDDDDDEDVEDAPSKPRIWTEWLDIENTLSPAKKNDAQERIKTLSVMLHSAPASFRIAKCIGYRNDLSNPNRTGLVYRVPQDLGMAVPISLLDIIKRYKEKPTPPLGDRFKLAQALATTLMQLHTSDWLHKAFRGDNILFFLGLAGPITDPYVAGFEYAREVNMQSLGVRPSGQNSLDYYYHPNVGSGFSKTLDLYSLGVVLLEIAYWRPLRSKIPPEHAKSLGSIHKLFVESADHKLDAAVGSIYANVVRTCLQCKLLDDDLGDGFACAVNTEIVLQLERCVA
ncbi:hypothetical protein AA0113_g641 [Alternaria arborescens]|uniref:Protein kinase domain-containing protein n=1 Tax=Alternaria arborescens TaxID=156630 RepID=A0A4Q4SPV5_9PLEO|nr:hypothetical protein AA0111_g3199 [Alternaria arborescens]RYO35091.1 hypothetical protein AA0111_g3199 [Alternaria arborescens]RYO72920.1 hypothetical protein AA0113_g641 [Alternaria arborescens]